jgi:hypothetical protein
MHKIIGFGSKESIKNLQFTGTALTKNFKSNHPQILSMIYLLISNQLR